jgi:hypothetical protein
MQPCRLLFFKEHSYRMQALTLQLMLGRLMQHNMQAAGKNMVPQHPLLMLRDLHPRTATE